MILTGAADGAFQLIDTDHFETHTPIPEVIGTQQVTRYHIEGGLTHDFVQGGQIEPMKVQTFIRRTTNESAQALLKQLRNAVANPANHPWTIQFNDFTAGTTGPWDGQYVVNSIHAPQASTPFKGRIDVEFTLTPILGDAVMGGAPSGPIVVEHNDITVGVPEAAIDFQDSSSVTFTVTDDPTATRILVSAAATATAGMNPMGNYNPSTTYHAKDVVLYIGGMWVASSTVTGVAPPASPWVLYSASGTEVTPEQFGAKGDGRFIATVGTVVGTPTLTISGAGSFTSADVGRSTYVVSGAGVVLAKGTITATPTSTTATISINAAATGSGHCLVASDDSTALTNAIASATDPSFGVELRFAQKIYGVFASVTWLPNVAIVGSKAGLDIWEDMGIGKPLGLTCIAGPPDIDLLNFTNDTNTHFGGSIRNVVFVDGHHQLNGGTDVDSVTVENVQALGYFTEALHVSTDADGWTVRDFFVTGQNQSFQVGIGNASAAFNNSFLENVMIDTVGAAIASGMRIYYLTAVGCTIFASMTGIVQHDCAWVGGEIAGGAAYAPEDHNVTYTGTYVQDWYQPAVNSGNGAGPTATFVSCKMPNGVDLTNAVGKVYIVSGSGLPVNSPDPHGLLIFNGASDQATRSRRPVLPYAGRHFNQLASAAYTDPTSVDGMTQGTHAPSRLQIGRSVLAVTSTQEVIYWEDHSDLMSNGTQFVMRACVLLPVQPNVSTFSLLVTDSAGPDTKTVSVEMRLSTDGSIKLFQNNVQLGATATGIYTPGLWIWMEMAFVDGTAIDARYAYDGWQFISAVHQTISATTPALRRMALDFNPTAAAGPVYASVDFWEANNAATSATGLGPTNFP